MSDDDRRRRSWREIDRAKDGSQHRKEERPRGGGGQRGRSRDKSYRAALDRLFDSGKIGELVEQKAPGSGGKGGESRLKAVAAIRDAASRDAVTQAVDLFVDKYGELPDDLEVLGRVLEHRNPTWQLEAMERIDRLLDVQRPKRSRAMVGQLRMIRDVGDDPELTELAAKLIDRLG